MIELHDGDAGGEHSRQTERSADGDYTERGRSKIAMQARRDHGEIRCPRDGAVMRVTASTGADARTGSSAPQRFDGPPPSYGYRLLTVDVRCPACRRHAVDVPVQEERVPSEPRPAVREKSTAGGHPAVNNRRAQRGGVGSGAGQTATSRSAARRTI